MEGTHEPLIDKDVFWQVQEQITNHRRPMKNQTIQIFAGLLKCADCGKHMALFNTGREKNYRYFNCNQYRMYGKTIGACTPHVIKYEVLYQYILERIQHWAYLAQQDEKALLQNLLNTTKQEQQDAARKQASELKKAEKRKEELDRRFLKVYEDWSDERITESNFRMLSQKYQAEQQVTEEKIARLKASMAEEKQTVANTEKWINLIRQYAAPTELTADLLNTLIEKILIHEPVKVMKGLNEQEIEILFTALPIKSTDTILSKKEMGEPLFGLQRAVPPTSYIVSYRTRQGFLLSNFQPGIRYCMPLASSRAPRQYSL